MLLIVIAALCIGLAVRERRAARTEAELHARLAQSWPLFLKQQQELEQQKQMELYFKTLMRGVQADYAKLDETAATKNEKVND